MIAMILRRWTSTTSEAGSSLVELMIALIVIAIGVLAISQLFPAGSRGQNRERMLSAANHYAQDAIEDLSTKTWLDPALSPGRHPGGTATTPLGTSGAWRRYYTVAQMAAPMDNLRSVTVIVYWTTVRRDSVTATTYLRR